jgi:hypothetical protein
LAKINYFRSIIITPQISTGFMTKKLLLGVEAIGQGAIDGGMSGVYAYPGTPSTEITEYIQENEVAIAATFTANGRPTKKQPWNRHWECRMPEKEPWFV